MRKVLSGPLPPRARWLLEARVPFTSELSAQVARSPHGQAVAYPVVRTVQTDGICTEVVCPAPELPESTATAAQDLVFTRRLLQELGVDIPEPTALALDNRAARDLAYNPEHHERTKHVERRHFYVRECVEDLLITVPFVASHDNLADFFTKYLTPKHFYALRDIIMNVPREERSA